MYEHSEEDNKWQLSRLGQEVREHLQMNSGQQTPGEQGELPVVLERSVAFFGVPRNEPWLGQRVTSIHPMFWRPSEAFSW